MSVSRKNRSSGSTTSWARRRRRTFWRSDSPNGLFEPIWNRQFIDHIQIDVPERLTVEGRAQFYDAVGAFKDMVVTHLFQILAFVAMEPPTELASAAISDEKNKVFRSMRRLTR